ncbi:MAG: DUF3604 domain-containing protein, partial [Xanthomonadales bacterium]|nr:DUF3604 domain-containing protein [Xanthomonadales bacterium]
MCHGLTSNWIPAFAGMTTNRYSQTDFKERTMERSFSIKLAIVVLTALSVNGLAIAADSAGEPGRNSGNANPLKNVYFGEQHLHTQHSPDAFAAGSRQTWDEAYRYGRGEEVTLHTIATKNKIKRRTPYDFMAITDHAEYFSVMPKLIDPKDPLSKTGFAKK